MKTILFIPTMLCNLRCRMCHFKTHINPDLSYEWRAFGKDHTVAHELDADEWVTSLSRFAPYHLEITGGEPLLYKDLSKIIKAVPYGSTWAITSNTLLDVKSIDLTRCISWTASYHDIHTDLFFDNLAAIRDRVEVSVSVVVEFDRVEYWIEQARKVKERGYRVNILRELNPSVHWEKTENWRNILLLTREGFNVVEDDIPPNYIFESGYRCSAGHDYFCAMPDGVVYRCYSEAMLGGPLGSITTVELDQGTHDCLSPCIACALDYRFRSGKLTKE